MILFKYSLVILMAAHVLLSSSGVGSQAEVTIKGAVLDKGNSPIANVDVRVYKGDHLEGEARTDKNGRFSISFHSGSSPVTMMRYDLVDWNPTTISDLSGVRDHDITKVLGKAGSDLSYAEQLELSATLERIYAADHANHVSNEVFYEIYGNVLRSAKAKNQGFEKLLGQKFRAAMLDAAGHAGPR